MLYPYDSKKGFHLHQCLFQEFFALKLDLDFDNPKTKEFKAILDAVGIDRSCLVAVDGENRNAAVSARNIESVDTIRVDQLNVFELLNHRYLVVDKQSIEAFLDGSAWNKDEDAA